MSPPQGVLAATALVGGGAGDGGARAQARCEPELLLCSVVINPLLGKGRVSSCWGRSPEGSDLVLVPLSAHSPPSQQWHLHLEESRAGARGARVGARCGPGCAPGQSLHPSRLETAPSPPPPQGRAVAALTPFRCGAGPVPPTPRSPRQQQPSP